MKIAGSVGFLFFCFLTSCTSSYVPKPRGYFRIIFPKKVYQTYDGICPYSFDYSIYANIRPDSGGGLKPCWINIVYPKLNAKIHLSYQAIFSKSMFNELVEDAHIFVFKHTVKATAIDEAVISYPEEKIHGILYYIDGNAASSLQFFVTDSTRHYLRGALYFNEKPRLDSIQPVLNFIKEDINQMIKTFQWKN